MTTGERIRSLRESHGLTQAQLAELTGYTDRSSITKIESGKAELSESKIAAFAKALRTTPAVILGLSEIPEVSEIEKKYNALDPHGKKVVDFVLDEEYKRCIGKDETAVPKTRIIPLFRAAAGLGEPVDGVPFEDYEILAPVPGDFAVKISGNSMEPEFHHGDIVMCSKRIPQPGEIGVIMVSGFLLVKQMQADNKGIYLHSFNKDYKDIVLLYEGNDTVSSYGTVIRGKKS